MNWLIWSNEHMAWWNPYEMGYTRVLSEAGRYSFEAARGICERANQYLKTDCEGPREAMCPDWLASDPPLGGEQ
jgi:hypothetical protein